MKRDEVDVFRVDARHGAVHEALLNWAAWARAKRSPMYSRSPLWKLARIGYRQSHAPLVREVIDDAAAVRVEKVIAALPPLHRDAMRWWYVWQWPSTRVFARMHGLTIAALLQVCDDARDMVANQIKAVA